MGFYPIADEFADKLGRWGGFEPWDATEQWNSHTADLAAQQHVDIRNFRKIVDKIPVPQRPDLEAPVIQSDLETKGLTPVPQTDLESKPGLTYDEKWTLDTNTGVSSISTGILPDRNGWSGLRLISDGAAMGAEVSSIPGNTLDISGQDYVEITIPEIASVTQASSWIKFYSGTNVSAQVAFNTATALSTKTLRWAVSAFNNSGFSNAAITKVVIHVVATSPGVGNPITLMALRAVKSTWVPTQLDFDTLMGWLVVPVSYAATAPSGVPLDGFQFIRGDGTRLDPVPADGSFTFFFSPGGNQSDEATGSTYNDISLLFREVKDIGGGTGSVFVARYRFNATNSKFDVRKIATTGGSPGTQTVTTFGTAETFGVLDPTKLYALSISIVGKTVSATLREVLRNRQQEATVWQSNPVTDDLITYRNGRVGFVADLVTRDAYLDAIAEATVGYAILRTKAKQYRNPVDGIQLHAVYSPDQNLFQTVSGDDAFRDPTKTTSGLGSFRTAKGITTNLFIAEDWSHLYLEADIWVPNTVTSHNVPRIVLNQPSAQLDLVVPDLQPSQWNHVHLDLGIMRDLITGIGYSFSFLPANQPDKDLGNFWVDSIKIGRRRVAWSARATSTGPFRQFWGMANDAKGAVHFNARERGREVQIRAEALTNDAWVVSFNGKIRLAELGNFVWDQNFETL